MLAYTLNSRAFTLTAGTSVVIKTVNPVCRFDAIPGDLALGIDIPSNDNNRALLGNPERFDKYAAGNDREFPGFEIRYSGVLLFSGTLVITQASKQNYSGWARSNLGNLGKEHREKYINEIAAFDQDVVFTNKANYNPLTDPYGCPKIFNPDFFKDKGRKIIETALLPNPDYYPGSPQPAYMPGEREIEALSVAFRRTAAFMVNALNTDSSVKTSDDSANPSVIEKHLDVYVVSPMLFLNYTIDRLLRSSGFFIDPMRNALAAHTDLQRLIIYGNYDITAIDLSYAYQMPEVQDWQNLSGLKYQFAKIDNIRRHYGKPFRYKNLLPKVKLKDFILSLQNMLNLCFRFLSSGKVEIIDREDVLTSNSIDISKYILDVWEMGERLDVTLKWTYSHDPDCSFFKEQWENIDNRRTDEQPAVETLADLDKIASPQIGEVRYVKTANQYWQYAWIQKVEPDAKTGKEVNTDMLGWEYMAAGFQNGFWNRGKETEETIETVLSTLPGDQTVMTYHRGNIESMKYAYENFTPRLLFYLGNNIAKAETASMSLDFEKPSIGLIETRWKNWARFWCNRLPVNGQADMPLNVIDYVTRNITSKFRGKEGEFIIAEMETEFGIDTIGVTKFNGYKI